MPKRPPSFSSSGSARKGKGWSTNRRKSRRARGYGPEWDKLRAQVLRDEPLCRSCKADDVATVANEVDHIKPKHLGGTDARSNLQPLCSDCHKKKTAKEAADARRRARY